MLPKALTRQTSLTSLLHQGDWESVKQNTISLSARDLLQYIMDDDDDDDDDVPPKPKKKSKKKRKKKRKTVEGSGEEKATSTKHKSTGAKKKKKKSKKKTHPPSLLEPNGSSESISILSDGLGATYLESDKIGLGAMLEEDSGWYDHHRDTACLEDEKTMKTRSPPPRPEATMSDSPESDNADMVLDHLHLLLDRLLDDEEYDINKWVHGTQWAIEEEKEDDRSKWNSRVFVPGEERSRHTYEDESGPTRPRATLPESTRTSVSKTKASKHKSLAKKEYTVVRKTAHSTSLPSLQSLPSLRSLPSYREDLPVIVRSLPSYREELPAIAETKPKRRSSMLSKIKKLLQMRDRKE
jgi:hypothetical protein